MTDLLQIKSMYGIGSKVLETSERLEQVFKFFSTYPTSERRNLNFLITTSYPFQLEDVSCLRGGLLKCLHLHLESAQLKNFDSDEAVPHGGDPHRPHSRLLKKKNAPGGGDFRLVK